MNILEQYAAAFQAAPGATLIAGSDGIILFTNSALDKVFGYSSDELAGKPIETLVPADAREAHPELRDAYLHLPSSRTMGIGRDLFGVSKTGTLVPVEIGLNHVTSGDESIVVASVLDLSERKRQEDRTRLAIDASGSAMIMADASGEIVLANTTAYEMFGYSSDELIGQTIELLIPSALRRRHSVYRTSYAADPSKRSMGEGRELFGQRKDGSEFPLEIGLTPIDIHNERLTMATVLDVTERKAAAEEIRLRNMDLTRLNQELAQFAYSASHDLKSPLASIEGLLGLIEEAVVAGDYDSVGTHASMAKVLSQKLKRLIEDILGLAKAENIDENTELVCIGNEVLRVTELIATAKPAKMKLALDIPTDLTAVTQPTRFRQIVENLVSNAVKFSDAKKTEQYVRISAEQTDNALHLTVEDNGVGIPENKHGDVFKLFKRFGNHDVEGSGLGLALVKQHTDSLGGTITFDSDPGGTRFLVQLPVSAAS